MSLEPLTLHAAAPVASAAVAMEIGAIVARYWK
jgi:hypothetical protein